MIFSWEVLALAIPAALFAGISKGGFGSAAAFASAAILALVLEPGQALGIMLPLLMLIDLMTLRPYWQRWSWPETKVLLLGSLPGVAAGAWLYKVAEADHFRLMIGSIALGFVFWQLVSRRRSAQHGGRPVPLWLGGLAGLLSGFASFVAHAGGPPAAVFLLARRLDKTSYQATTVLLFWMVNIAKAVPYAFLGIFTLETLWFDLFLAPVAWLGAWIGVRLHYRLSARLFFAVTYVLLGITGAKLIWDGLA